MAKAIAQSTLTNQALPVNLRIDNKPACPLSNRALKTGCLALGWHLS